MSSTEDDTVLARLDARLASLEQANARMSAELARVREAGALSRSEPRGRQEVERSALVEAGALGRRANRRGMLRTVLGAAVATAGASVLFQEHAEADNGVFTSPNGTTPAVTAVSTTQAVGISATTGQSVALQAANQGTLPAITASSVSADGVKAISTSGNGLTASTTSGTGVDSTSAQGIGVWARGNAFGPTGVGLRVEGCLQVAANSSGTSAIGQFTMPVGVTTVSVACPAATAASTILLTSLNDPRARLWIYSRASGSFVVKASAPMSTQVTVQYLVIN